MQGSSYFTFFHFYRQTLIMFPLPHSNTLIFRGTCIHSSKGVLFLCECVSTEMTGVMCCKSYSASCVFPSTLIVESPSVLLYSPGRHFYCCIVFDSAHILVIPFSRDEYQGCLQQPATPRNPVMNTSLWTHGRISLEYMFQSFSRVTGHGHA